MRNSWLGDFPPGFALMSETGDAAWFESKISDSSMDTIEPTSSALEIVTDGVPVFVPIEKDGRKYLMEHEQSERQQLTATWTFSDLVPGRMYQIFGDWIPYSHDFNTFFDVSVTVGSRYDGRTSDFEGIFSPSTAPHLPDLGSSFGFFVPDADGRLAIMLEQIMGQFFAFGAMKAVDEWSFTSPQGSFAKLETLPPPTSTKWNGDQPQFRLTDKDGSITDFDGRGHIMLRADRNGNRTQYDYLDIEGMSDHAMPQRLHTITDQGGLVTTYSYNADGALEKITDFSGRTTVYSPPDSPMSAVRTSSQSAPQSFFRPAPPYRFEMRPFISFGYDASGAGAVGKAVPTGKIGKDAQTGSEIPEAQATVWQYSTDANGNENKVEYSYQFDAFGHMTAMAEPREGYDQADVTKWTYNEKGLIEKLEAPSGRGADASLLSGTLASGFTISDYYDVTKFEYDESGNLSHTDYPDGTYESWEYDLKTGVLKSHTDRQSYKSSAQLDARGNVLESKDREQAKTTFTYTPSPKKITDLPGGLVEKITAPHGLTTEFTYYGPGTHSVGLVKSQVDMKDTPEERQEEFIYDANRNLQKHVDHRKNVTRYVYSELNQLLEVQLPAAPSHGAAITRSYYDDYGNVSKVIESSGLTTEYHYNSWNQLDKKWQPAMTAAYGTAAAWTYTYDYYSGDLASVADPLGHTTAYLYDGRGRTTSSIESKRLTNN